MVRRLVALAGLLGWLLIAQAQAQALQPVPNLSGRVIDTTATLTGVQAAALAGKLADLEAATGTQLVVLMVATTQPEDIAAYAFRVADQWKIGRRDVGDGLLVVVAKNDRHVRIEVAKALEGAVPDLAAYQVIDQAMRPAFRAGDYAGGLNAAVDRLAARIRGEGLPTPARETTHRPQPGLQWQDLGLSLLVALPIIGAVLTGLLGRKLGTLFTAVVCGGIG